MNTEKKIGSFVKQVVATLKGDDAEATGQKILRQADSALKTQTSSLAGDTISLEDKLQDTKDALESAIINKGQLITDRNAYVDNLLRKYNAITDAEETLEAHNEKLGFLNGVLANISK